MIRKTLQAVGVTVGLLVLSAGPADAAPGWVANSCAVQQALHVTLPGAHPETGNGRQVQFLPCGQGTSRVAYVTAGNRPYYVDPEGPRAPFCMQAGQRYYPSGRGAVITPTVRCH